MSQKVTVTFNCPDTASRNVFKDWVKTVPAELSPEGGQNLTWENIPEPEKAEDEDGESQSVSEAEVGDAGEVLGKTEEAA